jgi:hypothetical protein
MTFPLHYNCAFSLTHNTMLKYINDFTSQYLEKKKKIYKFLPSNNSPNQNISFFSIHRPKECAPFTTFGPSGCTILLSWLSKMTNNFLDVVLELASQNGSFHFQLLYLKPHLSVKLLDDLQPPRLIFYLLVIWTSTETTPKFSMVKD